MMLGHNIVLEWVGCVVLLQSDVVPVYKKRTHCKILDHL